MNITAYILFRYKVSVVYFCIVCIIECGIILETLMQKCFSPNPHKRPTTAEALKDDWMTTNEAKDVDLLGTVLENFNAWQALRSAVNTIQTINLIKLHNS
ncbi:hypothetical protein BY458DRAFT_253813 [Sporodiniella umbellata]|nr:hypothetical protein BY458DRAFT_253813 [Sporodiniella umbellata]